MTDSDNAALRAENERMRRAIARHRSETQCCRECGDAQVKDALARRKATADGRLWATIERAVYFRKGDDE